MTAQVTRLKLKRDTYSSRTMIVTPALAEEWLEYNLMNRQLNDPVNDRTVASYARDMKAGSWHLTGDPIKFDKDGILLDGQHRLWACVTSGVEFETAVVFGVDPDARIVIDTGKKRSLGHYLQMTNETQASALAAVVNLCYRWDVGNIEGDGTSAGGRIVVSHEDALEWLDQNADVRESVKAANAVYKEVKFGFTAIGAAHYLNARIDGEMADSFWKQAASGEELPSGSPILAWRRWAINQRIVKSRGMSANTDIVLVHSLKAMSLWFSGRTTRILSVKAGENVRTWGK